MSRFTSEPEADVENLNDDELMEAYFRLENDTSVSQAGVSQAGVSQAAALPDWPPAERNPVMVAVDAETAAWFKGRGGNWQHEIGIVLRAWIAAHTINGGR